MRVKLGDGELGLKDCWKWYKKRDVTVAPYSLYRIIIFDYLHLLLDDIIEKGKVVKLPSRLGALYLAKKQTNYEKPTVDWGTYRKLGVRSVHVNLHSDGYKTKFHWEKKSMKVKIRLKRPYSFVPARDVKRRIAKVMQEEGGHARYPVYI